MTLNLFSRFTSNPQSLVNMLNQPGTFLNDVYVNQITFGDAILTIRPNDAATAYYKGRQLFTVENMITRSEPKIYSRYLPIVRSDVLLKIKNTQRILNKQPLGEPTMTEIQWQSRVQTQLGFSHVRPEILDNIKKDSWPEGTQVSYLYHFSPLTVNNVSEIILLDVEAAFSHDGTRLSERIDVVLFNTVKRQLLFLEVKRLSDQRLESKGGNDPVIVSQLKQYQSVINSQNSNIIAQYNHVIETYNILSGKQYPYINNEMEIKLGLLVVDYNRGNLNKLKTLKKDLAQTNIKVLSIGHLKHVTAGTLADWYRKL